MELNEQGIELKKEEWLREKEEIVEKFRIEQQENVKLLVNNKFLQ